MADEVFPRARIAMGVGDLHQVQNFKISHKTNTKQVHTIRRSPAGTTRGVKETTVTFDAVVPSSGSERDYWDAVEENTKVQLRAKFPGKTLTFNGKFSDIDAEGPLDDAIKYSLTFVGELTRSQ